MATLKSVSRSKRSESLRGAFMIDTVRGVLRVRKWPRKRGTPKSALQRWWNDWFRQANYLAKYVDAASAARAIEITAGSGMYPRDVLLSAMRGRLYIWQDQTGKVWHPMAGVQDVSDSLDFLAQTVGDVLVRAVDRWRAAANAAPGYVLTYRAAPDAPEWAVASAPIAQQELAESPIACDDTVDEYILDVTLYSEVELTLDDVDLAASDTIKMRVSVDGGSTYPSGATSYYTMYCSSAAEASAQGSQFDLSDGAGAIEHYATIKFSGIQSPRMSWQGVVGRTLASTASRAGYKRWDAAVTHIKVFTPGSNNFKTGAIRAMGTLK